MDLPYVTQLVGTRPKVQTQVFLMPNMFNP